MGDGAIVIEDMPVATTLFLLSFHQRDTIEAIARAAGWQVIASRAAEGLEAAYLASGAAVVAIDARGALDMGLAATQTVGAAIANRGGALLILLSAEDAGAIGAAFDAGATQYLVGPTGDADLVQALRFAHRHAARSMRSARDRRAASPWPQDREAGAARRWIDARIAEQRPAAAILASLSRLDIVNAAHGRPAVDALIEAAVDRADAVGRDGVGVPAIVARLGGAEFLLAIEGDEDAVHDAIAALDAAMAQPFAVAETTAVLGCRFGVAEARAGDDAALLLRRAGEALAAAKASDGTMLHTAPRSASASPERLAIDLHHAIERDEIDIVFQPQVEIASGHITGVEALARWNHCKLGPLGADTLFAAADRADLGIALSDHIQQRVLALATAWPAALDTLRVSLNLSAADIARPGFAALFLARVDASGFPRGRLTIEITETGLIEDLDIAAALLAELRGAGCRVAIDDFGTGYSSLAYLKALPLDYVKIDKSLVRDIDGSARDRIVVAGAITMARSLGIEVIAEGVERPGQLVLLAAGGCSLYQGFLLSEPVGEAALLALMER